MIWRIGQYWGDHTLVVNRYFRWPTRPTIEEAVKCLRLNPTANYAIEAITITGPKHIPAACQEALSHLPEVSALSGREVFDLYCDYEGLIGYGPKLWAIVEELQ